MAKSSITTILENQGYSQLKRRIGICLIVLIAGMIIFSGWILFFHSKSCPDTRNSECFVTALSNCKRVSWIREGAQANWRYVIQGNTKGDNCKVEVRLESVEQGSIESEELIGKSMTCIIPKGETEFPEKDMSKCSGPLKESLQDMIIQKMHNYLIENIGEIKQEFSAF